jgi:outer membrane protein OmpA-like peptidoglycan-associated protein
MLVVGIAAVIGCGGISQEQYNAKEAEAAKYKQAAQEGNDKAAALESKVTSLQQQNATLQTQAGDLEKKLGESSAAKTELQERAPLRLNEKLLFRENSSNLTAEAKRTLDSMADAIGRTKGKSVIVSGFTDNTENGGRGAEARRWQLSTARALAAARYLAGRGIEATHIGVAGFGQARPAAPNDTLASRALNRRVEILLVPADQAMKTIDVRPAELTPKM